MCYSNSCRPSRTPEGPCAGSVCCCPRAVDLVFKGEAWLALGRMFPSRRGSCSLQSRALHHCLLSPLPSPLLQPHTSLPLPSMPRCTPRCPLIRLAAGTVMDILLISSSSALSRASSFLASLHLHLLTFSEHSFHPPHHCV